MVRWCLQLALADAETKLDAVSEPLSFYQNVSPSKELRDASNHSESLVRDFGVESSMRLDVFKAKVAAQKNIKESGKWEALSPEQQRLVDKMVSACVHCRCTQVENVNSFRSWTAHVRV